MSYAYSGALQRAIFQALGSDSVLKGMVDDAIFDMHPHAAVPDRFVALGSETVQAQGDVTGVGAIHRVEIFVVSNRDGFLAVKNIAARVGAVLDAAALNLAHGHLVDIRFERAKAVRRTSDNTRRVQMFFRARIDPAPSA